MSCTTFLIEFGIKEDGSCALFYFVLDFIAKTRNHSAHNPRFEEFTIPLLIEFVDGDIDEMLLCPIRPIRKYLS